VSSLVRLLNRMKVHRDVFGVYSKVDILYYSQNRKIERLHLKNAILLNEMSQRQSALRNANQCLYKMAVGSFDPNGDDVRTQAATAVNRHAAANHSARSSAFQEPTIPNERVATQKVHHWTAIESATEYVVWLNTCEGGRRVRSRSNHTRVSIPTFRRMRLVLREQAQPMLAYQKP